MDNTTMTTYQWQKNGENITDETSVALILADLETTDAGTYSIVATNEDSGRSFTARKRLSVASWVDEVFQSPLESSISGMGSMIATQVEE
jgi:hypothetical protein